MLLLHPTTGDDLVRKVQKMNTEFQQFSGIKPTGPGRKRWIIGLGTAVVVALLAAVVWSAFAPERARAAAEEQAAAQKAEEERRENKFLTECHNDIKEQLRDPNSAEFESESGVIVADDGHYTILSDARARNGFGGMNNFAIACTATYDEASDTFDLESQIIN